MLKINNLFFKYKNSKNYILNDVSLELDDKKIGILLGQNGSGKTTLFKNILRINKQEKGTILIDDIDISTLKRNKLSSLISYVPQHIEFGNLTVFESIILGITSNSFFTFSKKDKENVYAIIKKMGLEDVAFNNVNNLSGGQKQKVAIARALISNPKLIIFDEPTANLDLKNQQLFVQTIRQIVSENDVSILIALHDIHLASKLGDEFYLLKDGHINDSFSLNNASETSLSDVFGIKIKIKNIDGRKCFVPYEKE